MKDKSISRIAFGVGVIIVGVAALLGSFGVIGFYELAGNYWPLALVAAGLIALLDNPRQNYLWAALMIVFGVIAQLNNLDVISVDFWQLFWPIILIAVGWSVLTQHTLVTKSSADNITAILGGSETRNNSDDFQGAKVTTILGGSMIDLRKAKIKKEATLEVFALMGGVEVHVPEDWEVRTSAMPILGGIDNKAVAPKKSGAPVLHVVGTIVMGGVDIKN